jgi:Protein of unknown function (DUF3102)
MRDAALEAGGYKMADTLEILAAKIRDLQETTIRYVVEMGRLLTEAKELCPHGEWAAWLDRECKFKARTAENYMRLHGLSLKYASLADLEITVEAAYLLAAPSTPPEIAAGLLERAEHGEIITLPEVRQARQTHAMDKAWQEEMRKREAESFARQGEKRKVLIQVTEVLPARKTTGHFDPVTHMFVPNKPPVEDKPERKPSAPVPLRLVDDQSIAWLEKHELATALRKARDGGDLGKFADFLADARARLPDDNAFEAWLAKHGIELAADHPTLEDRAILAEFHARRNAPNKMRHA